MIYMAMDICTVHVQDAVATSVFLDQENYCMYHTLAYTKSHDNTANTDETPVPDGIIAIQNGHFFPQRDLTLYAAVAMAATATRARIVTPSLRQISMPYIRPIEPAAVPGNRAAIADYRNSPLILRGLEEIEVDGTHTTAGGARFTIGLFAGWMPVPPMPMGTLITMRGVATNTVTANAWSLLSVTWADALPAGTYACVGLTAFGATCQLARMIFEDQQPRPGVVGITTITDQPNPLFTKGGIGVMGRFNSNRMPSIEYLCNAADTAQEVYMDLVRVG